MKKYIVILFISLLAFPLEVSSGVKSEGELPPRFKKWLEQDVCYIITPLEKEVFLQLQTDRERDLFIEAFWKHRDPTSGTPENEFKEEHYRRINYANYHFGRADPKPGWKTDRGRIFIILGEPRGIDQAIAVYNKALSHYGINLNLLNSIAECYYRLGIWDEALAAWEKSLEINDHQPDVEEKVKILKKKISELD